MISYQHDHSYWYELF